MPTLMPTYPPLPPQPPPPPPPPPLPSNPPLPQTSNPSVNKQIPSLIQQNNSDNSHNQSKIMPLLNLSPAPTASAPPQQPLVSNSHQQPKSLLDLDQIIPHQRNNSNNV